MAISDVLKEDIRNRNGSYDKAEVLELIKADIEAQEFAHYYYVYEPEEVSNHEGEFILFKGTMMMFLYMWKEYELFKKAYKMGAHKTVWASCFYIERYTGRLDSIDKATKRQTDISRIEEIIAGFPCFDKEILYQLNHMFGKMSMHKSKIIDNLLFNRWIKGSSFVDILKSNMENINKMKELCPLLFEPAYNIEIELNGGDIFGDFFTDDFAMNYGGRKSLLHERRIAVENIMNTDEVIEMLTLLKQLANSNYDVYQSIDFICVLCRRMYNMKGHKTTDYTYKWVEVHKKLLKFCVKDEDKRLLIQYIISLLSTDVSSKKFEENKEIMLELLEEIEKVWPKDFYNNKLIYTIYYSNSKNKIDIIKLAKLLIDKPLRMRRTADMYSMLMTDTLLCEYEWSIFQLVDCVYGENWRSEKKFIDNFIKDEIEEEELLELMESRLMTEKGCEYIKDKLIERKMYKYIPILIAYGI